MALQITNTDNVTDNATLELAGASGVAAATHNGTTYLYVTGLTDDGVSAFSVASDGTLTNVANITDDSVALLLNGANATTTASVGGHTYLFVTGFFDLGVSVFEVMADGTLVNVDNVGDDTVRRMFLPAGVTAAEVGGTTYLFVTGFNDHGVSVFSVAADGHLTDVDSVGDDATLQLRGAGSVATAQVGGTTYLFVAGTLDHGVSVFRVETDGTLVNAENVSDDATLELQGASGVATAQVGATTYLFATGGDDDGVSVFRVEADGILVNVDNVSDDVLLALDGAGAMTTAVIGSTTYLFVIGPLESAIAVFEVAADGTLTHVTNINDPAAELDGALGVTAAAVGGTTYLFATGFIDDGVSAFSLIDGVPPLTITSDGGGDLADVSVAENTTAVTTVVANDPGGLGPTYSISGGIDAARFQIDSSTGVLAFVTAPDFEAPTDDRRDNTYVVEVRASAGSDVDHQTITVDVTDVAEQSPSAPIITSNGGGDAASVAVDENTTAVTTVTATDPGNIGGLSYSITGGADAARFAIDSLSGVLSFVAAPDFEAPTDAGADNSYVVEVRASAGNQADHQTITVNVTDIAEQSPSPPIITSDGGGDTASALVDENTTAVTTVTAIDPGNIGGLSYSISGGADAARFAIDSSSGVLSFVAAPDFEAPSDAGADNGYVVEVQASAGNQADHQTITVNVTDIAEQSPSPPIITSDGGGDTASALVDENTTAVTTVTAIDPGNIGGLSYSISGGADAARFAIDSSSGVLSFVAAPDFEAPSDAGADNGYVVEVQASDGNQDDRQTITVNVTDVVEGGPVGGSPRDAQLGDVLWRHGDGTVATAARTLGDVPDTWRIAETGDFDRDGDSEILWRHRDGLIVSWEMENGAYVVNHNLGTVGTNWEISGTGDFDGDGDSEILWHHRDGAVVTWEMEDNGYVVNHNLPDAATTWQISGTGDFDGDGDADILWRHRDGAVVTWEMENGAYVVNHNLADVATTWQISGTGDFDGDGDADILWRHRDGAVVTWEMEDGAFVVNHNLPNVATTWQIQGTRDFDGDGDADILWRHDEGDVVTWEMEEGAFVTNHNFGVVATDWQIERAGEFDLV